MAEKDRPIRQTLNRRRETSTLVFARSEGEFFMRGGICWPINAQTSAGQAAVGFALLLGLNVNEGVMYAFEEQEYRCIDHIVSGGEIKATGLAPWFNICWQNYYAAAWFWHQPPEVHKAFSRQVRRSHMIQPKPSFVRVPWQDREQAAYAIWQARDTERLVITEGGDLDEALRQYQARPGQQEIISPAVHALTCALCGLDRFPWTRERQEFD